MAEYFSADSDVDVPKSWGEERTTRETPETTNALSDGQIDELNAHLKQIYSDQCYLLTFAKRFASWYPLLPNDYSNYSLLLGDPGIVLNHLTAHESIKEFLTITPAQVAALIPKIEIYKLLYKDLNDKTGTDYLFKFPTFTDVENLTENRFFRGDGAGITGLTYTLEGKNPATGNIVDVNLKLKFQDIKFLFHKRTAKGPPSIELSFAHLITYPGSPGGSSSSNIPDPIKNPDTFRIKMVLGWQDPGANHDLISPALRTAIRNTKTVLLLDLQDYTIDFADDGSVDLQIHYRGAIEATYGSYAANILALSDAAISNIKGTTQRIANLEKAQSEQEGTKTEQINNAQQQLLEKDAVDGVYDESASDHSKAARIKVEGEFDARGQGNS